MIPSGNEPTTFRFVAQCLNHCATAVPLNTLYLCKFKNKFTNKSHKMSPRYRYTNTAKFLQQTETVLTLKASVLGAYRYRWTSNEVCNVPPSRTNIDMIDKLLNCEIYIRQSTTDSCVYASKTNTCGHSHQHWLMKVPPVTNAF
jgi:hypothetical protein